MSGTKVGFGAIVYTLLLNVSKQNNNYSKLKTILYNNNNQNKNSFLYTNTKFDVQ